MCLIIKTGDTPKIAKKDIVVYKHLISNGTNKFITSYKYAEVEIGKTYTSEFSIKFDNYITKGLHAYVNVKDAKKTAKQYFEVLVKCVIPKGSKYYKGVFANCVSIASDTLTYVEILKNFENDT